MMATLAVAWLFPSAGHAAAWGVLISGVLQAALVGGDTWRAGVMTSFRALRWDDDVRRFFKALMPATVGSAGTQLALFADTIIASFLSAGAISALYYADRIDQLPIGVIGIAVGTVLVPEMTHRLAVRRRRRRPLGAKPRHRIRAAAWRSPASSPFWSCPAPSCAACSCAARSTPRMRTAAAMTLMAYTIGLVPFVLIRSVVAPFLARGDTATPVKAALTGTAVNIAFKIALMGRWRRSAWRWRPRSAPGSISFWCCGSPARAGLIAADATLKSSLVKLAAAGVAFALFLLIADPLVTSLLSSLSRFRNELELLVLALLGGVFYGGLVVVLFGRRWLVADARAARKLRRRRRWTHSKARRRRPPGRTKFSWGRKAMRVTMIGAGYVGLVSGACFADFGHQVTCIDKDAQRVAALNRGEIPIFEPGLADLVEANVRQGRLRFAVDTVARRRRRGGVHRGRHAVAPRRRPCRSELRL